MKRATILFCFQLIVCMVIFADHAMTQDSGSKSTRTSHPTPAPHVPKAILMDTVRLTQDDYWDLYPAIAFSATSSQGSILWTKRVSSRDHEMYCSFWNNGQWQSPTYVPGQQSSGHKNGHSLCYRTGTSDLIALSGGSFNGIPTANEVDSRQCLSGNWDAGPVRLGDKVDDDDYPGGVRYSLNSSYALGIWQDAAVYYNNDGRTNIIGQIWNHSTLSWGDKYIIQPNTGMLPRHVLKIDNCLALDPITDSWIIAYQTEPTGFGSERDEAEIAYHVGNVNLGSIQFGPEEVLSGNDVYDGAPIVSFNNDGDGAIFWSKNVKKQKFDLMVSRWNPSTLKFENASQITDDDLYNRVHTAVPAWNGWHVIFTRQLTPIPPTEMFYAWYDGVGLKHFSMLTFNDQYEGDYFYGIHAGETNTGEIYVVWAQWDGTNHTSMEIYVGELVFL